MEAWEAANTAEALSMLEASGEGFRGLITDINMPGTRSGVVLANHVCRMWPHIRVIVISAALAPMAGELPHEVEFLAKPILADRLVAALRSSNPG
jgi:DNA-binding LytR/AlgR family response regulator